MGAIGNTLKHGAEGWRQGDSCKELVWQIYRFRRVLFENVMEFARGKPNELERRPVEKHAEESSSFPPSYPEGVPSIICRSARRSAPAVYGLGRKSRAPAFDARATMPSALSPLAASTLTLGLMRTST